MVFIALVRAAGWGPGCCSAVRVRLWVSKPSNVVKSEKTFLIPLGWTSDQGFFFFLSECSVMALSCLFSSLSFFHSVFNLLQNSTFPHLHWLFVRGNGACNAVNATITNNSFKKKKEKNKRGRNEKFVSYFQDYSFCSLKQPPRNFAPCSCVLLMLSKLYYF